VKLISDDLKEKIKREVLSLDDFRPENICRDFDGYINKSGRICLDYWALISLIDWAIDEFYERLKNRKV